MANNNEKLTLLNRAGHAPKLRDTVNGGTTNGHVLTWDSATGSWYPAAGGTNAAPSDAQYVTLALHASLPNERVLAVGDGLTKTDNGAGATVQLQVALDNVSLQFQNGAIQIKPAGVTTSKLAFQPRRESFIGNGVASVFNLTNEISDPNWYAGVVVARNGQLLKFVTSEPSSVSEFKITTQAGTTSITLGAALPSQDELLAIYWA